MVRERLPGWGAVAATAFGIGIALLQCPTAAAAAAGAGKPKVIEEMVITGSRIARAEGDFSTPVTLLSNESIEQQGSQNIADILYELPSVGTPTSSRTNSNFNSVGNGVSTLNLRNLDDKRTLVLMNGRRLASGLGGTSTVDLNNIPTDLIDRVEVITGGASAVYGSEAVAGVVNFVLKQNFEGVRVRAQAGQSKYGDNSRPLASVTGGLNFLEHGNVTVNVQLDKDGGLRSRDRTISKTDFPFKSSFVPQGRFAVPGGRTFTYTKDNVLKNTFVTAVDGFNRDGERYISVPVERKLLTGMAHFDFNDALTVYAEGSYAKVTSNARLEPFPSASSDANLPDGSQYRGLTLDNPFIPADILANMNSVGATRLPFRKRMVGVFDRSNQNDRKFYHYVVGVKGELFSDWNYDAYVSTSKTTEDTHSETALRDRYFFALDAIANPAGGAPICRDAAARAAGCAPFNPFGFNSVSAAAAKYITRNGVQDSYEAKVQQDVGAANVTGTLYKLPAGELKMAAGVEFRKEKSSEVYAAETQTGNTLANAFTNTKGDYDVREAYVELNAPVLRDLPGIRTFDLEAAARAGDYSTVGSVFSWKVGGTWSPIDSVKLRAVYAKATRAPNIGELFQGLAQTFPPGIQDGCNNVTATSTRKSDHENDVYCRTIPGIAQQIAANGIFVYNPNSDSQSIQGFDGGNPNLGEETARTTTLGVVFTPEFAPSFSASVDWFRVKIAKAITLVPRQTSVDQCVATGGTSPLCALITREPIGTARGRTVGTVFNINAFPVNAALIESSGIDVASRYRFEFGSSSLDLGFAYTYLRKLNLTALTGLPTEDDRGQLNGDGRLGAGFKHRANLSATYAVGGFKATWRANFLSAMKDTLTANGPSLDPGDNKIEPYLYNDVQVRYNFGAAQNYDVFFGVDNLFNKKPPLIGQNGVSNVTGTETAADSYDPIGRFFYFGFEAKLGTR